MEGTIRIQAEEGLGIAIDCDMRANGLEILEIIEALCRSFDIPADALSLVQFELLTGDGPGMKTFHSRDDFAKYVAARFNDD